nr:hypothetical protein [uncultured Anaeromusa sp.]
MELLLCSLWSYGLEAAFLHTSQRTNALLLLSRGVIVVFFSNCGKMEISELRKLQDWNVIPAAQGIYKVVSDIGFEPRFSAESSAIPFKGKDPRVDVAVLKDKWFDSTDLSQIIYIGKAGGLNQRATLRQRIKAYIKFGNFAARL